MADDVQKVTQGEQHPNESLADFHADTYAKIGTLGEAPSDKEGMSVTDGVISSYDDSERAVDGIAEGERQKVGRWLKHHADAVGTDVVSGVNSLLQPAIALRNGNMETKRQVIGSLVDNYQVTPETIPVDEFGDPVQRPQGADPYANEVETFMAANPMIQHDAALQASMTNIAQEFAARGEQFNLDGLAWTALSRDPRFAHETQAIEQRSVRVSQDDRVVRARRADVMVSGGGNSEPSGGSDDVNDILNELVPRG